MNNHREITWEEQREINKIIDDIQTNKNLVPFEKIGTCNINLEKYSHWFHKESMDFFLLNRIAKLSEEQELKINENPDYSNNWKIHQIWKSFFSDKDSDIVLNSYIEPQDATKLIESYTNKNNNFSHYKKVENLKDNIIANEKLRDIFRIQEYIAELDLAWDIVFKNDVCMILSFNKKRFVIPADIDFVTDIKLFKNYSKETIDQLIKPELEDSPVSSLMVQAQNNELSKLTKESIENNLNDTKSEMENVFNYQSEELKPIYDEIEKQKAELKAKENELREMMYAKQLALITKKAELEKQLFMLETQIYSIRCFLNECIDFIKLRTGKRCDIESPIILHQKLRFLDEEFGRLEATTNIDFTNYDLIEKCIKENDEVLDCFCPSEKGISLIRISKDNKAVARSGETKLLENCKFFHGTQLAILIRDGDNVYLGWCDEDKINISDDVFVSESSQEKSTAENIASRLFIFTILKGAVIHSNMIELPVSVKKLISFSTPSPYVIYSSADNRIVDETYKELGSLVKGLNNINKEKDDIILLSSITDGAYNHWYGKASYDRSVGYTNRTHDAKLKNGLNKINLIVDDKKLKQFPDYSKGIYVSALKEWSMSGKARANMLVENNEFINLTYLNSKLIKYFIDTKRIGKFNIDLAHLNYTYIVPYLKEARLYLEERESKELEIFKNELNYPLDQVDNWQNYISSFKLLFKVRNMTSYQGKRFLKWYLSLNDNERNIYSKYLIVNEI